jgi:preprotein translocase subunit SecD
MVLVVVLLGTLLALPTFFPVDPVLQVSNEDGSPLGASAVDAIGDLLERDAAPSAPPELDGGVVHLRFESIDAQLRAGTELEAALPGRVVAFNLRPRVPGWFEALGLEPVTLGLDLRGGLRFVYEVDLDAVSKRFLEAELGNLQASLRDARIRAESGIVDGAIVIELDAEADVAEARRALSSFVASNSAAERPLVSESRARDRYTFTVRLSEQALMARREAAMKQNVVTLSNRVNELGVSEAVVQRQGASRIAVEVPGVQDPAQLDRVLGSTATLEWRLVDMRNDARAAALRHNVPPGSVLRYESDGTPLLLRREVIASGERLTDATFGYSQGRPAVFVRLDRIGARDMREATLNNIGKLLAVVYVEEKRDLVGGTRESENSPEYRVKREETVIFNGRIDNVLSDRFELRGLPPIDAQSLALQLRAGALAAPLYKVHSGAVSPTLGQENIAKGRLALIAGFLAVVSFMAWYYGVFGLIADLALLANLVIVIGLLSLLSAALSLPGMAGIVLTAGMAVDANVLIFERIREELEQGRSPQASIDEGYEKAFATIADANVTTLAAGAALFAFGTGPIKGFAVTLSLGVLTSMFTAVLGTRAIVDLLYGQTSKKLRL